MTTLSWVPRITIEQTVAVTPTITNNNPYFVGYQVGGILTLPNIIRQDSNTSMGTGYLTSVSIIDKQKVSTPFDIWFFKVSPTLVSTDHAPFSITSANLLTSFIGRVQVGSLYSSAATNTVSTDSNLNMPVYASSGSSLYAVVVSTSSGSPTWNTTTDLTFQFSFLVD